MDHRRLEESFLLFAGLQVMTGHNIMFDENGKKNIPQDRNNLMEMIVKVYEKVFYEKWTGKVSYYEN
jgi:hypothetical protein